MENFQGPLILLILDGWGVREASEHNAIAKASTPNWDKVLQKYPHTLLDASGHSVGLPEKQMGNSEVGHIHIGSGRLVKQDLTRISHEIKTKEFFKNEILNRACEEVLKQNSKLHIIGLTSPGGIHSHEDHIIAAIDLAHKKNVKNINLHAILDGRDTPPRSAKKSITKIQNKLEECGGKFASIMGRYYAMDRDQRWERVKKAYDLLTLGKSEYQYKSAIESLEAAYSRNENDEFVSPTSIIQENDKKTTIDNNDVVIFMNFRADRARQLSWALTKTDFCGFKRDKTPKIKLVTLTKYDSKLDAEIAYPPQELTNVLGEVIANNNLKQLRIAETEKYAHVTFFVNGGRERVFAKEDRILVPSPKVATYDLKPEMNATIITDHLIDSIKTKKYDFIICNYANADMVGHTGNFAATVKAIEALDKELGRLLTAISQFGGEMLITADHGNAEKMYDHSTHQPHTAHTNELVPLVYIGRPAIATTKKGQLIDIASTALKLMNIDAPNEMAGKAVFNLQG